VHLLVHARPALRQVDTGIALVCLVGTTFNEAGLLHLVEHHGERWARDVEPLREVSLRDARIVRDFAQAEHLRRRDTPRAHPTGHELAVSVRGAHEGAEHRGGGVAGVERLVLRVAAAAGAHFVESFELRW
jgi:hypothetical protein